MHGSGMFLSLYLSPLPRYLVPDIASTMPLLFLHIHSCYGVCVLLALCSCASNQFLSAWRPKCSRPWQPSLCALKGLFSLRHKRLSSAAWRVIKTAAVLASWVLLVWVWSVKCKWRSKNREEVTLVLVCQQRRLLHNNFNALMIYQR